MKLSEVKYYNNYIIEILLALDGLSSVDLSPGSKLEEEISNILKQTEVDIDTNTNTLIFKKSSSIDKIASITEQDTDSLVNIFNKIASELSLSLNETIDIMTYDKLPTLEELHEAKMKTVKRSHGEKHPSVKVDAGAKMRNKIIEFMGSKEKYRVTKEELNEFFNQMNEDDTPENAPSRSWVYKNKNLIEQKTIKGKKCFELTRAGRNLYEKLKDGKINESKMYDMELLGSEYSRDDAINFVNIGDFKKMDTVDVDTTEVDAESIAIENNIEVWYNKDKDTYYYSAIEESKITENQQSIVDKIKNDPKMKAELQRIDSIKNKDDKLLEIEILNKDLKLGDEDLNTLKNDFPKINKAVNESKVNEGYLPEVGDKVAIIIGEYNYPEFYGIVKSCDKKTDNEYDCDVEIRDKMDRVRVSSEIIPFDYLRSWNDTSESLDDTKAAEIADIVTYGEKIKTTFGTMSPEGVKNMLLNQTAEKAAEILMNGKDRMDTKYDSKSIEGIIDLIKRADVNESANYNDIAAYIDGVLKAVGTINGNEIIIDRKLSEAEQIKLAEQIGASGYSSTMEVIDDKTSVKLSENKVNEADKNRDVTDPEWEWPEAGKSDKITGYPENIRAAIKFWKAYAGFEDIYSAWNSYAEINPHHNNKTFLKELNPAVLKGDIEAISAVVDTEEKLGMVDPEHVKRALRNMNIGIYEAIGTYTPETFAKMMIINSVINNNPNLDKNLAMKRLNKDLDDAKRNVESFKKRAGQSNPEYDLIIAKHEAWARELEKEIKSDGKWVDKLLTDVKNGDYTEVEKYDTMSSLRETAGSSDINFDDLALEDELIYNVKVGDDTLPVKVKIVTGDKDTGFNAIVNEPKPAARFDHLTITKDNIHMFSKNDTNEAKNNTAAIATAVKPHLPEMPKESDLKDALTKNNIKFEGVELDSIINELVGMGVEFDTSEATEIHKEGVDTGISNMWLKKIGRDTNGNKTITIGLPNDRGTSVQMSKAAFPQGDSILRGITNLKEFVELPEAQQETFFKEIVDYINNHGSSKLKGSLKVFEANKNIRFTDGDIKRITNDGEYYYAGGGNEWEVRRDTDDTVVANWYSDKEQLDILDDKDFISYLEQKSFKVNEGETSVNETYREDIKREFPEMDKITLDVVVKEWESGDQTGILDRISTIIAIQLGYMDTKGKLLDEDGYSDVISKVFKIHDANESNTGENIYSEYYEREFSVEEIKNAFTYYKDYMEANDLPVDIVSVDEVDSNNIDEILYHAELQGMSISESYDTKVAEENQKVFEGKKSEIREIGKALNIKLATGKVNKNNYFETLVDISTRIVESKYTDLKQERVGNVLAFFTNKEIKSKLLK